MWVSLEHATFILVGKHGVVVDAPPIAKWTVGKNIRGLFWYYKSKGANIQMSGEDYDDFPGVQVSTFIKGDQYVFRAADGETLFNQLKSVAENANDIMDAMASVKKAVLAKAVFTGDGDKNGGGKPAAGAASTNTRGRTNARAKDQAPPRDDIEFYDGEDGRKWATLQCEHGDMLDLRGNGYKADLYCSLDTKDYKKKCRPVSL